MQHSFVVTYDIADPKRLRKVFMIMSGWGVHLQYSVFRCDLNPQELAELKHELAPAVHNAEDQVLFIDLGPLDGRAATAITSIGQPYVGRPRGPTII